MDSQTTPEQVSQRLKNQFTPAYLTLTSIIQGVALSALVIRVESNYPQFTATDWLLSIATFVVILAVWNEYVMMVSAFVWVPTLLDSVVPFAYLASELFVTHFAYHDLRLWLLTIALLFLVGGASQIVTTLQSRRFAAENRDIRRILAPAARIRTVYLLTFIVLSLGAWALYDVAQLAHAQALVAGLALLGILVFLGSAVPYWNRVLLYAQGTPRKP
ncbi:MAG: hypothetical protein H0X24_05345 [Ktedonobacterales bacterium]|nr:hypothetical protein [Ktedonobacterales bacterium]